MIINPILPIWLLVTISIVSFLLIIKAYKNDDIDKKALYSRLGMIILLFMINLRPMYFNGKTPTYEKNADVLMVIDTSISMNADDYGGVTRLEGAKRDAYKILEDFSGSRFAVVNFDNAAHLAMPFTTDTNIVKASIEALRVVESVYANGSKIDLAFDMIEELLLGATQKPGRLRIVYYFGDGEQTAKGNIKSFAPLKKFVNGGTVLGYGTTTGGRMKDMSLYKVDEYIKDKSGGYPYPDAISKINESNLQKIAEELGLTYQHRERQRVIDNLAETINFSNTRNGQDLSTYNDLYWVLSLLFLVLVYREIWYVIRKLQG